MGGLFTAESLDANPMPSDPSPRVPKSLPKGLGAETVSGLLGEAIDADSGSPRRSDWPERDAALVLIGVLAGLWLEELLRANVGDIRTTTEGGGVIQVRGKGSKNRRIPVEML